MNKLLFLLLALVPLLLVLTLSNNMTHTSAATTTTQNMTKYTDTQNRFTIQYPTSWTVKQQADRFESPIVKFQNVARSVFSIDIINGVGTDPETFMNVQVATAGIGLGPEYSLFQDVECSKYKVDGQRACSVIYTKQANPDLGTSGVVSALVFSYVNGNMYSIDFAAPPTLFDSLLPTFDAIIHSIKVTAGNSTAGISPK